MPHPDQSEQARRGYRIDQFAATYSIGRDKIYDEIREGRLEARKSGKVTIIPSESAERWFNSLPPLELKRHRVWARSSGVSPQRAPPLGAVGRRFRPGPRQLRR
jgi:hypothetical protein